MRKRGRAKQKHAFRLRLHLLNSREEKAMWLSSPVKRKAPREEDELSTRPEGFWGGKVISRAYSGHTIEALNHIFVDSKPWQILFSCSWKERREDTRKIPKVFTAAVALATQAENNLPNMDPHSPLTPAAAKTLDWLRFFGGFPLDVR